MTSALFGARELSPSSCSMAYSTAAIRALYTTPVTGQSKTRISSADPDTPSAKKGS